MYILVMNQLLTMLLIGIGGFIFSKLFKVSEEQQKFLSKLLLYFINPCLVFNSFNIQFDGSKLLNLAFVVFISLIIHGTMILVGIFSSKESIERIGIVFTNCGFVGIPLIRGVFGDTGVFYLMGYLIIFNIFLWTYGYYQISGTINLKKIITNPNILAVCFGLILYCLPITLPVFIAKPISMIGDLNTATSMILVGILFSQFNIKESKKYILKIIKFSLFRLIICSIVNILLLALIYKIFNKLPDSKMLVFVTLICSMCPSATSIPSLACLFDKDAPFASILVSVTSLLCIITIPSFVALAELIIK